MKTALAHGSRGTDPAGEVIACAAHGYHRFALSAADVEDRWRGVTPEPAPVVCGRVTPLK